MSENLEALRDQINALSPADRLVLAAELLRAGKQQLAEPIIRRIADELAAIRLWKQPALAGEKEG